MGGGIGSSFDDFLKEEGLYEALVARAKERVVARERDQSAAPHDKPADFPPEDKA
jgi:hypothetical protein